MSIYWPLPTDKVTGWPGSYRGHVGTDFGVPIGTPVPACFAGTVVFVGGDGASGTMNGVRANGEGKTIDIRRADGLIARYGHLNGYNVTVGQKVNPGDILGWSGNTGYSTGPHLHWELRWDRLWAGGRWVDPRTLNPLSLEGDDDMTPDQAQKLEAIYAGMFGPQNIGGTVLSWASANGPQQAFYGNLEIDIHTQSMVAKLQGQVAALTEAVKAIPGGKGIDMGALERAAEKGAREALAGLVLKAES